MTRKKTVVDPTTADGQSPEQSDTWPPPAAEAGVPTGEYSLQKDVEEAEVEVIRAAIDLVSGVNANGDQLWVNLINKVNVLLAARSVD